MQEQVRMSKLEFHEVDAERWRDLERLFESRGGPESCWCMVWRAQVPRPIPSCSTPLWGAALATLQRAAGAARWPKAKGRAPPRAAIGGHMTGTKGQGGIKWGWVGAGAGAALVVVGGALFALYMSGAIRWHLATTAPTATSEATNSAGT